MYNSVVLFAFCLKSLYNSNVKSYYIPPSGFTIFGIDVKFYGLIMSLAMLIGVWLACVLAKKKKVSSDDILLLALLILPCSIVGARLYYCFFYEYNYSFWELFNLRNGGLAIYGGVIGGIIGIIIFALIKHNWNIVFVLMDICVPCLIFGQALGRWGNFFNQEAYGNLITDPNFQWFPFAVFIENQNAWFQATFFYESLWNFVGFILLLIIYYKTKKTGTTTACYLIWYGIGRTLIEGLRADSLYITGTSIRVSQALSVCLVIVGIVILTINIIKRVKEKGNSNGQKV